MRVLVFSMTLSMLLAFAWATIFIRTHVQLGLSCQQLLLKVKHSLPFTMQHVYSHAENLGNECADHAAVLGAFWLSVEP